jgi:hypothetical protein
MAISQWVSLVAQRLFWEGFGAPIMADSWRIPRDPICRIAHGLIACDHPKTEPWKPWKLIANDNLVISQGGVQPQPGDLCLAYFPSFSHGIKSPIFNSATLGTHYSRSPAFNIWIWWGKVARLWGFFLNK